MDVPNHYNSMLFLVGGKCKRFGVDILSKVRVFVGADVAFHQRELVRYSRAEDIEYESGEYEKRSPISDGIS